MKRDIVFIGAGNLASLLAKEFFDKGNNILSVYNKTENSARILANVVSADWTNDLKNLPPKADFYFLAVPDQFVEEIIKKVEHVNGIIVHCSGSLGINIINEKHIKGGVFYPLQTLSKERDISFLEVPVCIESNDNESLEDLLELGSQISDDVRIVDTKTRQLLHVAAVFVCNFVNHMYTIGEDILIGNDIHTDILKPLMKETFNKAVDKSPKNVQTGPALRNDHNIVKKHLDLLSYNPNFQDVYRMVSNSISSIHNKKSDKY